MAVGGDGCEAHVELVPLHRVAEGAEADGVEDLEGAVVRDEDGRAHAAQRRPPPHLRWCARPRPYRALHGFIRFSQIAILTVGYLFQDIIS